MNDDGTMARLPDLKVFAREHGLKIGTIEDMIAYRLQNDRIVTQVAEKPVESAYGGEFRMHVYETHVDPAEHIALVKGDVSAGGPVLVRVHAVSPLTDLAGIGSNLQCGQIEHSMRMIGEAGSGVLVLIRDVRPRAISEWIAASNGDSQESADDRKKSRQVEVGVGSQILADLGVKDMILLTNSPQQNYVGLEAFGLRIVETRMIG